jgi:hypothetical protein
MSSECPFTDKASRKSVSCGLPSSCFYVIASQTFVRILLVTTTVAASSHTSKTSQRNAPIQDTTSVFLRRRLRRAAFAQSNPITHHERSQLSVSSSKIEREPAINSRAYYSYPRRRRWRLWRHQHRFDRFGPFTPPSRRLTSRVTAGLMRFCTKWKSCSHTQIIIIGKF